MTHKVMAGECISCESTYYVEYVEQLASQEIPQYCPFCGTRTEDVTEEHIDEKDQIDDENDDGNEDW